MKVVIRPFYRESAYGWNKQTNYVNGRVEAPSSRGTSTYSIGDLGNGYLNIGFHESMDNPYYNKKEKLPSNWIESGVENEPRISRQTYFEIKHNKPKDFYNPRSFSLFSREPNQQRTYLQNLRFILNDGTTILDLDNERDEVIYEYLIRSSLVSSDYQTAVDANGKETIVPTNTKAKYYFASAEEAEKNKVSKAELKMKALSAWENIINKYPSEIYSFALLLEKSVKGKLSDEKLKLIVFEFLDKTETIKGVTQQDRLALFMEYYNMLVSKSVKEKAKFAALVLLTKLVRHRVLTDYQDRYLWKTKAGSNLEVIGKSKEEALEFLLSDENEKYVQELKMELAQYL